MKFFLCHPAYNHKNRSHRNVNQCLKTIKRCVVAVQLQCLHFTIVWTIYCGFFVVELFNEHIRVWMCTCVRVCVSAYHSVSLYAMLVNAHIQTEKNRTIRFFWYSTTNYVSHTVIELLHTNMHTRYMYARKPSHTHTHTRSVSHAYHIKIHIYTHTSIAQFSHIHGRHTISWHHYKRPI